MLAPDSHILDVRTLTPADTDVRAQVLAGLDAPASHRALPTVLLYDETGLRIYDKITTDADEYYLFACEEQILKNNVSDIVRLMRSKATDAALDSSSSALTNAIHLPADGEVVLELGAGALRKTSHILRALADSVPIHDVSKHAPPITYYALDLEERELDRTLKLTSEHLGAELDGKVDTRGMLGTYDAGLKFVEDGGLDHLFMMGPPELEPSTHSISPLPRGRPMSRATTSSASSSSSRSMPRTPSLSHLSEPSTPSTVPIECSPVPLHLLFLGSSLGNFSRAEAAAFLKSLPLRPGSQDTLLLGLDHDNGKEMIERAYDDRQGITRDFILNGLKGAGRALGNEDLFGSEWAYHSFYNEVEKRHEAYYRSTCDQTIHVPPVGDDDKPVSVPFSKDELIHVEYSYKYSVDDALQLFQDADLRPVQRWTDSRKLYSLWLLERPPFQFPLLKVPSTTPDTNPFGAPTLSDWEEMWKAWDLITLQMITPHLLHQKPIHLRHKCLFYLGHIPAFLDIHLSKLLNEPHTEPEEYKDIFERGIDPNVDDPTRCHDHSEVPQDDADWPTLLEILSFRDRVRDRLGRLYYDLAHGKIGFTRRIGRVLMMTFEHEQLHAETLLYMLLQAADGSATGTQAPDGITVPSWDLIARSEAAEHKAFSTSSSTSVVLGPTNLIIGHNDTEADDGIVDAQSHEFGWDNENPQRQVHVPAFRVELRPVSNGEFFEYWSSERKRNVHKIMPASWMEQSGQIAVRTLFGPVPMRHAWHWPVIASYDDLAAYAKSKGGRIPTEPELRFFMDTYHTNAPGTNVGFQNWHPIAPTTGGGSSGGQGHNGGVWEWSSTVFDRYEGYEVSQLYPGYSADFFDGCHQVVLGASYATPPRIAQRRTFRNWYQRNYPFAWTGARIAYDL
ncbi:hypothetical protein SISSUDRAFT_1038961 [Sistotremastrum suecicum HHB10207 ss-3]|uniref:DUF323 domain-containing protein n=1 Tax=Sistotremastrum suecicum HHB10207 ss-3 TaxID=1314776 RepID=A0A166J7C2_9AGAM|nr:hypothetical protein SISSUDRAFT_1038961 [Sistotremastrum suecicum HHB10207 ss-3]